MELLLSHRSALEYWRLYGDAQGATGQRQARRAAPVEAPDISALRNPQLGGLTLPLDVTVSTKKSYRKSNDIRSYVFEAVLPRGSVVDVGGGLLVSSPELCFFQMASELVLVKLIELGFELCGSYSLPGPRTTAGIEDAGSAVTGPQVAGSADAATTLGSGEKGFINRSLLTSTKKLSDLAAQIAGSHGTKKAIRALQYIENGSASPMETVLVMLLSLPYKLGGYGLCMPELNAHITPAKSAKRIAGQAYYSCDLFWPDYDVAVEYDSDLFHTGADRIARDSKRRNALASMGITVVTVTNKQMRKVMEFEKVAKILATCTGKRLHHNENPKFHGAQRELRSLLL